MNRARMEIRQIKNREQMEQGEIEAETIQTGRKNNYKPKYPRIPTRNMQKMLASHYQQLCMKWYLTQHQGKSKKRMGKCN